MEIENRNIFMCKGDSESITMHIKSKSTGEPYPITEGMYVELTIHEKDNPGKVVMHKTTDEFDDDSTCVILINSEDTENLRSDEYEYEVELHLDDERKKTIVRTHKFYIE